MAEDTKATPWKQDMLTFNANKIFNAKYYRTELAVQNILRMKINQITVFMYDHMYPIQYVCTLYV